MGIDETGVEQHHRAVGRAWMLALDLVKPAAAQRMPSLPATSMIRHTSPSGLAGDASE